MPELAASNLPSSEEEIVEAITGGTDSDGLRGFNGFTGTSCGGCKKTINIVRSEFPWVCVCGHSNAGTRSGFILYASPDLGPTRATIHAAVDQVQALQE